MVAVTGDEGGDADCGLRTAAGRRSLWKTVEAEGGSIEATATVRYRHRSTETYGVCGYCGYWCGVMFNTLHSTPVAPSCDGSDGLKEGWHCKHNKNHHH